MTASDHRELPLRDYDHLPLPSVAERIRQDGPDYPPAPHETSTVSPRTAAPPLPPPPHGVPAQPGQPKGDRPPI